MSTPSPVSDESTTTEGTVLRDFVDQAIAQKRVATMSPRSALLSQSSLQAPTADERSSQATNEGGDAGRQVRKRSAGSRRMRGMEVARTSTLAQLMDVDLSRKDPKDEVMRLREILKTVERHSVLEARRAKELERANQEAERRMQVFAENQLHEKQEALKAQQEVRLVQLQLQNAQEEIDRKQREMRRVERQRDDAEAEAARAREKARKLHEQTVAAAAREEGRRLGFQAGFDYASQERRILAAKRPANPPAKRRTTPRRVDTVESQTVESHKTAGSSKGKQRAVEQPPASVTTSAFRPSRSEFQSQQYSQYEHPVSQHSLSERQPPPAPVAQFYGPPPPEADDNLPGPEDDMSPSQLGLRSLPVYDTYSRPPSRRSGPSHSTPHRRFAPSPEIEPDREEPPPPPNQYPPPPDQYLVAAQEPPQVKTPAIEIYEIDLPTADQLNREYSFSQENSSEAIPNMPREQWVPAATFHERRGTRAPPALKLPPSQPQPWRPAPKPQQQPTKAVKFPNILSRPSLLKTKEQASSWYRSLSWRKKSKPVIDPIPEEGTTPISAGPFTGSTYNESQPPSATEPPDTTESQGMYGGPHLPQGSWYQAKQPLIPPNGPASMRSGYSRVRAISDAASVSTRVSQFDLLATPHPNAPPAMSVRSGKEGARKLKEKESYLSAITEDPASRNNTPSRVPRPSEENMRSMASVLSQPNFGNRPVQQQASYGTLDGAAQNNRRQRRMPPAIAVPDPGQELEPFGVAYNRGAVANGYQPYMGADLNRRPSRISERTTPDTSIGIDIVPPVSFTPCHTINSR
ncbi:hypothetical protein HYPSUDRAFT_813123 [Hypholoma sublateritium FD-334 SS-4]|uniref:Uncharacterized protein n=1 Tax=Hypholoma sublateritium (strain FD-334 SS-4) TaxID=945553 RepID=A0A0D2L159_HYPSF|nr:hypothetical protein HYPSUDRAFT_813123 [Hypholoma sublateritium FD-334 SS-4]